MVSIKYLGRIIEHYPVPDDYEAGHTWIPGELLTLDSNGKLTKADDTSDGMIGVAMEMRQAPVENYYIFDQTKTAGVGSVLTGESVVETDVYESGVTFAVNDELKVGPNGRITNTGTGKVIGRARKFENGVLTLFFRPEL
jgi:hypothetical protein